MLIRVIGILALILLFPVRLAAQPVTPDVPVQIGGINVACTGASLDGRDDPRWTSFSLKLEFVGAGGRYLGGESVILRKADTVLFSGSCSGPWLLFGLPAGRYHVEASLDGQIVTSSAIVSGTGQARVILRFPETISVSQLQERSAP